MQIESDIYLYIHLCLLTWLRTKDFSWSNFTHTTFVKSWMKLWCDMERFIEGLKDDFSIVVGESLPQEGFKEDNTFLSDLKLLSEYETIEGKDIKEWIGGNDQLEN